MTGWFIDVISPCMPMSRPMLSVPARTWWPPTHSSTAVFSAASSAGTTPSTAVDRPSRCCPLATAAARLANRWKPVCSSPPALIDSIM